MQKKDRDRGTGKQGHEVRTSFAEQLKRARLLRGIQTARSLASAMGIEENRYTRYERGEVEPDLALLCALCRHLGVTPNDLLQFHENDTAKRPEADAARIEAGIEAGNGPDDSAA